MTTLQLLGKSIDDEAAHKASAIWEASVEDFDKFLKDSSMSIAQAEAILEAIKLGKEGNIVIPPKEFISEIKKQVIKKIIKQARV